MSLTFGFFSSMQNHPPPNAIPYEVHHLWWFPSLPALLAQYIPYSSEEGKNKKDAFRLKQCIIPAPLLGIPNMPKDTSHPKVLATQASSPIHLFHVHTHQDQSPITTFHPFCSHPTSFLWLCPSRLRMRIKNLANAGVAQASLLHSFLLRERNEKRKRSVKQKH